MVGLGRILFWILLLGRGMGDMLGDWGFVRGWIVGFMKLCCEGGVGRSDCLCCVDVYFNTNFGIINIYQIITKNNNARIITTITPKITHLYPNNLHPNRNNRNSNKHHRC